MKIRKGFVSNSSSSSFCIVGTMFPNYGEQEDYNSYSKGMGAIYKKYLEEIENHLASDSTFEDYIYDKINKEDGCKLTCTRGLENYGDETSFLGFYISALEDDETFMEFKQKLCRHLNTCFELEDDCKFTPKNIETYIDGGYNG